MRCLICQSKATAIGSEWHRRKGRDQRKQAGEAKNKEQAKQREQRKRGKKEAEQEKTNNTSRHHNELCDIRQIISDIQKLMQLGGTVNVIPETIAVLFYRL